MHRFKGTGSIFNRFGLFGRYIMEKMYAIIGVDVETDVGSFTPYYEGVRQGIPALLRLFGEKGIRGTFFFTGDAARCNPEQARQVAESGNELGCHSLYHETVGDELFPIPGVKPILPEEVYNRLRLATEWVETAGGVRPVSFRAPRLWGSTSVLNALEKLGYTADASYPMYFYRERFAPYFPLRKDWTKAGGFGDRDTLNVLEIPNFADMTMKSDDSPLERDRDQWPLFRTEGAVKLMEKIRSYHRFAQQKGVPTVICLYIHPWEFIALEKSYNFGECTVIPDEFIVKNCGEAALRELADLIDFMKEEKTDFLTCAELANEYKLKG